MSVNSVGLRLDERDSVRMFVSRGDGSACMELVTGGTHCEIVMGPAQVEMMRRQLPAVLADLARGRADDISVANAVRSSQLASDLVVQAVDMAAKATEAGAHEVADILREAATDVMAKADALDAAVLAVEAATVDADDATESLALTVSRGTAAVLAGSAR